MKSFSFSLYLSSCISICMPICIFCLNLSQPLSVSFSSKSVFWSECLDQIRIPKFEINSPLFQSTVEEWPWEDILSSAGQDQGDRLCSPGICGPRLKIRYVCCSYGQFVLVYTGNLDIQHNEVNIFQEWECHGRCWYGQAVHQQQQHQQQRAFALMDSCSWLDNKQWNLCFQVWECLW